MGSCFSKKKGSSSSSSTTTTTAGPSSQPPSSHEKKEKTKEAAPQQQPQELPEEAATGKKQVFIITPSKKKKKAATTQEKGLGEVATAAEAEKNLEIPTKDVHGNSGIVEKVGRAAPVRSSSCTKEEIDAILIQCGRLSRSSSGKASNETGHKRYSGSKRSYDFDYEKKDEEEWENPQLRPPSHRRTPSRERDGGEYKRSGSRERRSDGGRRVSRSPGRRSDGPASSSSNASSVDKSRQPGKMVSVPALEKGSGSAGAEAGGASGRKASSSVTGGRKKRGGDGVGPRNASPRSRSPANTSRIPNENAHQHHPPHQPQSLSRSSSKKADQSPCRRNPMAEIDENALRAERPPSKNHAQNINKVQRNRENDEDIRKPSHSQQSLPEPRNGVAEVSTGNPINGGVRKQLMSCRAKEEPVEVKGELKSSEISSTGSGMEAINPRTRSSRRSSRDLDANLGFNPDTLPNSTSYTTLLLEDIHNYHQQNTVFALPACVSKACSILEAVADLNSSFSNNKSSEAGHSHDKMGLTTRDRPFVESEVVVKDDLLEPSLQKYVSVRDLGEMEPQESAGSNSFVGQPWASPPLDPPNSVDSSNWTSSWSNNGGDVEEEEEELSPPENHQQQRQSCGFEQTRGRRLSSGATSNHSFSAATTSGSKKTEFGHRQLRRGSDGNGGDGKVAAAASS